MKHTHRFLSCLIATVSLCAQEPAGATPAKVAEPGAEQLFRDAWWAESGNNDTAAALRGYLEAVATNGTASVRARALLFAGRLQQRLGKPDAALASFRRLLTEFATETALVNEARTHLRELTTADLRQNYDEWYERRLFSEEVQLMILGKLENLASWVGREPSDDTQRQEHRRQMQGSIADIQAFGKGAGPALRKYALGADNTMARTAINMLFAIDEMPPLQALLRHSDVLYDADLVGKLLTMHQKEAMLPIPADDRRGRLLVTILAGPDALTREILTDPTQIDVEALQSIVHALLPHAAARAQLLAALQQPGLAVVVREAIENACVSHEQLSMSAAEWLAVGADSLRAEVRHVAQQHAATTLRPDEADLLDRLLAAVVDAESPSGHDQALVVGMAEGLARHPAVDVLPWNTDRLGRLLRCLPTAGDPLFMPTLQQLRRAEAPRLTLAEALFADPVAICSGFRITLADDDVVQALQRHFETNLGSDADTARLARRWHTTMVGPLTARWASFNTPARLAAIVVLCGVALPGERGPLVNFLRQQEKDAPTELKQAIDRAVAYLGN